MKVDYGRIEWMSDKEANERAVVAMKAFADACFMAASQMQAAFAKLSKQMAELADATPSNHEITMRALEVDSLADTVTPETL